MQIMEEHPRGIWIWRLANLANDFLEKLVQSKVKRVYLNVCDGKSKPMFWGFQCTPELIQSFKIRKIQVYGWGYHHGTHNDID